MGKREKVFKILDIDILFMYIDICILYVIRIFIIGIYFLIVKIICSEFDGENSVIVKKRFWICWKKRDIIWNKFKIFYILVLKVLKNCVK